MMLKHSRWSGRRLMPSGGGWMTPNPNGGVAACLVWNRQDQKQSDAHEETAAATHSNARDEAAQVRVKPASCGDINIATSITVAPHQPTVVITPACSCSCPRHHRNTAGRSVAQSRSTASQQMMSSLQHRPTTDKTQFDGRCCRGKHLDTAIDNDECCLRRSTTVINTTSENCGRRDSNPITACEDDEPATPDAGTKMHVVRQAWIAECRTSAPHQDGKVHVPAERATNSHRLRDVKYSLSTGKVVGPLRHGVKPPQDSRHVPVASNRRQSAADNFATCTDQLTTNILASLAAYQDVRENDLIDAVRGYLRRQPSPTSSRRRRPSTARRPATTVDSVGSRTVELRQGDVGPLSSLVVIRPATPQPRISRANAKPPTPSDF